MDAVLLMLGLLGMGAVVAVIVAAVMYALDAGGSRALSLSDRHGRDGWSGGSFWGGGDGGGWGGGDSGGCGGGGGDGGGGGGGC
ncbi:hypothetical protein ACTWP5_06430 [Streptomyces sp. 4N509B]|uniref:hypothetical protein n=1 Tax=Streptomyces sp. 4N509B TaxID=3457413 RepID=UPI003FD1462A